MFSLVKRTYVALDFETANAFHDSACAVAMVRIEDGKVVAAEKRLINPQTYFLDDFVCEHGITPEAVKDAPLFAEAWQDGVCSFNCVNGLNDFDSRLPL